VEKTISCWNWLAFKNHDGYGSFRYNGRMMLAYHFPYELIKGKIPQELELDHLCRNRACVNPDHLQAVSKSQNQRRGFGITGINARKTHCKNGHEFSKENTYIKLNNGRVCKICSNNAHKVRYKKNPMKYRFGKNLQRKTESIINN